MSKIRESTITNCEKHYIATQTYKRLDRRNHNECRELDVIFGAAFGSCLVSLGKTKVLAEVSCNIEVPKLSRPSEGLLNINVELNPIGAPHFQPSRSSDLQIHLVRMLEKSIKDSKAVDLESLCIKAREKVLSLRVDVNIINHDGNLLECSSAAALCALAHFRRPHISYNGDDFIIDPSDVHDPVPIVLNHYPVCTSYALCKNGMVVLTDPVVVEENVADGVFYISINAYREICGMYLGGNITLTTKTVLEITNASCQRTIDIINLIKTKISEDNDARSKNDVGFHNFNVESKRNGILESLADQWSVKSSRKRKHKKNDIQIDDNKTQEVIVTENTVTLQSVKTEDTWQISSDED